MSLPATSAISATLYDFESGVQGWTYQTYTDSQAISAVAQSSTQAQSGTYSLQGTAHLVPGDVNYSKGEVYVDRGASNLLNLQGLPTSVWVYGPAGSAGTNPSSPNGWQMFFKDSSWRSWYGPWSNLVEDSWENLSVTLGTTTPDFVDAGFDTTQIIALGVKLGTGGASTGTYDGSVYFDDYDVIPEPNSLILLGTGLVGVLGLATRRKKN